MSVIDWLLEPSDPSVRYRTLVELLDRSDTPEAREAQRLIPDSAPVKRLLGAMHPDGYWLQKKSGTGVLLGDGVEYGSFGTTHFCLSYCAESGLNREHPLVAKAAERYLSLQQADGDWWMHLSCLYAYNIRTFIMLGYREDERLKDAWAVLDSRMDAEGLFKLCWTPKQSPWKAGKEGEPNKWVTLYCLLAKKHAGM